MTDAAFEEAVQSVEDAIKKLKKAWKEIVDNVNWALKFLPGPVGEKLRNGITEVRGEYKDADIWLLDHVLERGSAGALRDVASDWSTKIGDATSARSKNLALGQLPSNGQWSGPASLAYRTVVDVQTRTLDEFTELTHDLAGILNDIADALKLFWIAIATEAALLAVAMIALGAATATGVGAIVAIPTALGAIVAFWAAVATAVILFHNSLDSNKGKLDGTTAKYGGAESRWPAATANMSDATVADDDPSDWIPNL
jgi:hypothetical protein